jgi:hypothetical protein
LIGGAEKQVLGAMQSLMKILENHALNTLNFPYMADSLRVLGSTRHFFDFSITERLLNLHKKIIEFMVNSPSKTLEDDVVRNLFSAAENLMVAVQHDFYRNDTQREYAQRENLLKLARDNVDKLAAGIVATKAQAGLNYPGNGAMILEAGAFHLSLVKPADLQVDVSQEMEERTLATKVRYTITKEALVRSRKPEVAIVAYDSFWNPYELAMPSNQAVVSGVLLVNVRDKATNQIVPLTSEGPMLTLTLKYDEHKAGGRDVVVRCGHWDKSKAAFLHDTCTTHPDTHSLVHCKCKALGEFALTAEPKDLRPVPLPLIPDLSVFQWRGAQLYVPLAVIICLAVGFYYSGKTENSENGFFDEKWTVHPLFSIVVVSKSRVPRLVKVHLLACTIAGQLAADSFIFRQHGFVGIVFFGLLLSYFGNYLVGILAKCFAVKGREVSTRWFLGLCYAFIVASLIWFIICIGTLGPSAQKSRDDATLVWAFVTGVLLDLLVIDVACVFLVDKFPAFGNLVRFRGFQYIKTHEEGLDLPANSSTSTSEEKSSAAPSKTA